MVTPLILFKTRDPKTLPLPEGLRLELPASLTFDQSRIREADAVVFHTPEWSWSRSTFEGTPKYPGQLWIAWSMESEVNYRQLADHAFMRHFDLRMTYQQDADIWHPYLPGRSIWLSIQGSSIPAKTESRPTALFQSDLNDKSGRNAFSCALMRHTMVDSYGKVLKNRNLAGPDVGPRTKVAVIGRYHFCLALENSIAPDYVTEKVFDALLAGTVPIYRGAQNIGEFVPEGSFIDATAFGGPKSLADYLHHLLKNPTDYAAYFAWRHKPLSPWLMEKTAKIEPELAIRLQCAVAKRLKHRSGREIAHYPFGLFAAVKARARMLKARLRVARMGMLE